MAYGVGPNLVRDGLVLYLDAANPKSYPGSGTIWNDLTGGGNNGTLVNGVGYTSDNGGAMVFDGVDDYAQTNFSINGKVATISVWCNVNATGTAYLVSQSSGFGNGRFLINTTVNLNELSIRFGQNTLQVELDFEKWNLVSVTRDVNGLVNCYVNAEFINSFVNVNNFTPDIFFDIGGSRYVSSRFFNGKIAQTSIYNRTLTPTEIQQNFNSNRGRFGL
jgi:hypothetical protein